MARGDERSGFDILVDCATELLKIAAAKELRAKRRIAQTAIKNAAARKLWLKRHRSWPGSSRQQKDGIGRSGSSHDLEEAG